MNEFLIRVRFECDSGDYKMPNVVVKEVFVCNNCEVGIPTKEEIDASTREAGFTEVNVINIKVFKEIE